MPCAFTPLKNLSFDGGLLNIPLFLADCTKGLVEEALRG